MSNDSWNRSSLIAPSGIVVLDVDGVIFPQQFIVALARRRGPLTFVRTVADCMLFNVGRIGLEKLLARCFGRLKDMPWGELVEVFQQMRISPGTQETIRQLRSSGMIVLLLTAGVPDALVKDLARQLGADGGAGTELETHDGRLTGRVFGELARPDGKAEFVARLVTKEGISWRDVVAVGDDSNNLPLMRRAGISVGFHATYRVRREVRFLVESDDLSDIVPYAPPKELSTAALRPYTGRQLWFREVLRKCLHLMALPVPFLAARFPVAVTLLLLWLVALYLVSEFWRLHGIHLPGVHRLHQLVMRRYEARGISMGPLTLALGVLAALWGLPENLALACILIAVVADSCAAIIGGRWGLLRWPHNRLKSVEGSAAFFISALVCGTVYLPIPKAIVLALLASFIESLPLQDWDNFLTPVGAGLAAGLLMG